MNGGGTVGPYGALSALIVVAVRISIRIYEGAVALFLGWLYVFDVSDHFGLLFLFAASKRTIAQKRQDVFNRTNDC
jgi:hypothetical protein